MSSQPIDGTRHHMEASDRGQPPAEPTSCFDVADQLIPDLALLASRSSRLSTTLLSAQVIEWMLKSFITFRSAGTEGADCLGGSMDAKHNLDALWDRAAQLGLKTSRPEWIRLLDTLYDRPYEVRGGGIDGLVLPIAQRVLLSVVQLMNEIRPVIK